MPQALPVSAAVNFLREVLEANEFLSDLWIVGEVSGYTRSQLGHRYFALRDSNAALRTVLFRDTMAGMQLQNGDHVIAHGHVTVYPQRGELQFVCDFIRPEGVGILAAKFEELRERLGREGLFAEERKRPLPRFPMTIGIVTSPAGAALQDVRNVLARRWPLATLVLARTAVQGPEAPAEIAAALRLIAAEPGLDLVILARGGGSAEDLAAFNTEVVARAIYGMPVPVVTGVGHETDVTIADFVADLRAPTPSAAAERATPDIREVTTAIAVLERTMASAAGHALAASAAKVESLTAALDRAAPEPTRLRAETTRLLDRMSAAMLTAIAAQRHRIDRTEARLAALNPLATLERGFAIVQDARSRRVVNSVRRVKPGARLSVAVTDGAFWAEVS
jgi:exodeoxyribonuclease VII large subunit